MKAPAANIRPRKASILIPVLVIIPLIGIGLYVVPNLFDTTPPLLTVSGVEKDKHYRGSLTLSVAAMDENSGLGSLSVQIDGGPPNLLSFVEEACTF